MEIRPSHVYLIDIDQTLCDSSKEYAKWREFCVSISCVNLNREVGDNRWCRLESKARCIYESRIEGLGIFGEDAIRGMIPYPAARKALRGISCGYYITGRGESLRKATLDWLEKHRFPMLRLLMRQDKDMRMISEIKKETIQIMISVYGEDGQSFVCIDDDSRMAEVCDDLGIGFLQVPKCWGERP